MPRNGSGDDVLTRIARRTTGFDPRPREGGDIPIGVAAKVYEGFDPRPREGGDAIYIVAVTMIPEFRSTPPRGRRRGPPIVDARREDVSIHAPAREATRIDMVLEPANVCFDPRPREGGDLLFAGILSVHDRFRSTPPRGRRPRPDQRSA